VTIGVGEQDGGGFDAKPGGSGGIGGGGAGAKTGAGGSGTPNTGGGGGGVYNSGAATAGTGGSGIAIIRYPDTFAIATSTTGSPNVIYANANIIYRFWQSGTITF
jgi:hypothetical protein